MILPSKLIKEGIKITALNGIDIKSETGAVNAEGLTFKGKGQASATVESSGTSELKGSAMASVSGAIVRIN